MTVCPWLYIKRNIRCHLLGILKKKKKREYTTSLFQMKELQHPCVELQVFCWYSFDTDNSICFHLRVFILNEIFYVNQGKGVKYWTYTIFYNILDILYSTILSPFFWIIFRIWKFSATSLDCLVGMNENVMKWHREITVMV